MSERTKVHETVTADEYGDIKLIYGKEGSNWRPIKVDADGKVVVV